MDYKKIIIAPLEESLDESFLNDKCNLLLNNGKEFIIDLNSTFMFSQISSFLKESFFFDDNNLKTNQLTTNLDLKYIICNTIKNPNIKPEMLLLYIKIDDKFILLNDFEIFSFLNSIDNVNINNSNINSVLNSEMRSTGFQNAKKLLSNRSSSYNGESKNQIIYYKICNYFQNIIIDFFQNQIEKIKLNIPISCSVYMLKYLIFQKVKNQDFDLMKNFNLYGVGFLDKENVHFINKQYTNKKFTDDFLIYDIMKYYLNPNKCFDKILNLILIKKTVQQCSIGLDFRFNIMRNFQKLENYDLNASSYRNVSDGLNLFIYCLNDNCKKKNNFFTICKGYGSFNIFHCLKEIKCPFCNLNNFSLRNLGMINAKWKYKGFLKGVKESKISGDGCTLENGKLYIIKEIIFENQFHSLYIEIEFFHVKNNNNLLIYKNSFQSSIQNIESSLIYSSNDISESDLNNINLEQKYLNKNHLQNKSIEMNMSKEFTFEKQEKNNEDKIIVKSEKDLYKTINENNNNYKTNNNSDKNNEENDQEIIKLFQKQNSNNSIKSNGLEIDIKLDYKKHPCCIGCVNYSKNSSCILW